MTIHKAGTMLTLTNELGTLRGKLYEEWETGGSYLWLEGVDQGFCASDWTITPDRTLPTTPGSVIRADVNDEIGVLFARTAHDKYPWCALDEDNGSFSADRITNWTLLFDAGNKGGNK